jgi:hypothetical protein
VFTDVAGFSDPVRNDGDRDVVRTAMYEILRSAFEASGVPWAACYREDRGDGAVIVVPPTISTQRVVDPLVAELTGRLRQYNRRASEVVRIQLRVALHVGPVGKDAEGLTGQAVISAARIVDAPVIKARLAAEQADLVFAAGRGHPRDRPAHLGPLARRARRRGQAAGPPAAAGAVLLRAGHTHPRLAAATAAARGAARRPDRPPGRKRIMGPNDVGSAPACRVSRVPG